MLPPGYLDQYPMQPGKAYIFLGEIPNMGGHCIVVEKDTGKFHVGYHTELFKEMEL